MKRVFFGAARAGGAAGTNAVIGSGSVFFGESGSTEFVQLWQLRGKELCAKIEDRVGDALM